MLDIAIVEGLRTPFVKAFGELSQVSPQELGRHISVALLERAKIKPDQIDQTIFGNVAPPADAANISRVIALTTGIPEDRIAHTVHRNCASGMESITTSAQLIQLDEAERILAGGTESMSQIPLLYNKEATKLLMKMGQARSAFQRLKGFFGFRPRHFFKPIIALKEGLTDPVSGMIMGKTAEVLVDDFKLTRESQDEWALLSHQRAIRAQEAGHFKDEIVAIQDIEQDIGPRNNQSMEALAKLRPIFQKDGTVTVGNSCMVTDGAGAVLIMSGEKARSEGREPLGYLRAFAYAGCDPKRMGLGPTFATNKLLKKTGLSMNDIDLIEINEAFAAVVLANERAFASAEFAREKLDRSEALGEIDRERLNVNGGAIALGHPVGATGTRLAITMLRELKRRNLKRGLATLCVGGGQGAALLLETN